MSEYFSPETSVTIKPNVKSHVRFTFTPWGVATVWYSLSFL